MNAKSKSTNANTNGMEGEDFAYGGAGPVSEAKKPAVVAGEVKKTSNISAPQSRAKADANEADWGNRNEGQQIPGGIQEAEESGKHSKQTKQ